MANLPAKVRNEQRKLVVNTLNAFAIAFFVLGVVRPLFDSGAEISYIAIAMFFVMHGVAQFGLTGLEDEK